MRVGAAVGTVAIGVGVDRVRHVILGGLEQSAHGEPVVHVVGIKVGVLENLRSLDAAVGEEIDQECRDITGITRTREALGARVAGGLVFGGATVGATMWSGWATFRVAIIAAVVPFAKLANTRSVNHLEGKLLSILKVVEDRGVGLGEGLSLM